MRNAARSIRSAGIAFGLVCAIMAGAYFWLARNACSSETLWTEEVSGLKFEITYTNCDTLAKDEAMRVYVENATAGGFWRFPGWRRRRTLLFRYDPESYDAPPPSITVSSKTISISIPEVSSISYKARTWGSMSIRFDVGKVDYPL
jgi:hypothetical protein